MFLPIFAIFIIAAFIIIPYFQQMKVFIVGAAAAASQARPVSAVVVVVIIIIITVPVWNGARASERAECRKGRRVGRPSYVRLAMPRESRAP